MIVGALKDGRFYAGIVVAFLLMYGLQYYRGMKAKGS
jgi:hypothetical protein